MKGGESVLSRCFDISVDSQRKQNWIKVESVSQQLGRHLGTVKQISGRTHPRENKTNQTWNIFTMYPSSG